MSESDRIERLEQRLAALENVVRELAVQRGGGARGSRRVRGPLQQSPE